MNLDENKKAKLSSIFKTLFISIVLVTSYVISVITSSFSQTNKKFLVLLICFVSGVGLFLLIYSVFYLVTFIRIGNRAKKKSKSAISCDDKASKYFENNLYRFKYDSNTTFSANVQRLKTDALLIIKDVADIYDSGKDKYYYLGFTAYDATSILYGALDLIDSKISPIFKFLRAEDKPLNMVENLLEKAIESEELAENEVSEQKPQSLIKKIGLGFVKVTANLFRGKIENAVTDVVKYVGFKAFEVYEKNGKLDKGELYND